jgi:hypothetical protein
MDKVAKETLKAELEGIETGLEVLESNVSQQCLLSSSNMELIERMEKRINNMKEILEKD